MTPEERDIIAQQARDILHAEIKAEADKRDAEQAAITKRKAEDAALVEDALKMQAREFARGNRLNTNDGGRAAGQQAPAQLHYSDTRKYDHLDVNDLAFMAEVLGSAKRNNMNRPGISDAALKALAIRISEDKSVYGDAARADMKAMSGGRLDPHDVLNSMKANELDYSTQAGFGDEWVGVEYSRRFWPVIRQMAAVAGNIPTVEIPDGAESMVVPLESTDPTWNKVAQTTGTDSTTLRPNATVPSSKVGTDQKSLTVAKLGARVIYSMELEEDSFVTWAPQLRQQMEKSGAETLDHIVIDGDTATAGTTNINSIGGTPGGTEAYLLFNGLRKSPLVTTTANSRSASGSLADTDFLATIKLMGPAGLNALDKTKVAFIVDLNVGWKVLELASVKTRDVFTNATIENGVLMSIWGYPVITSAFMHWLSATNARKANTAGKVDLTSQSNNTTGSILAVRWDQWLLGYKRRIRMTVQEFPDADSAQLIALCRVGMVQRDTEASAISYNVGV
jgi:hypothetical protein